MLLAVAHQDEAGIVRHLCPLVKIECQRVGLLNSLEPRGQFRREHGQRTKGAVHMKPELLFRAKLRDACQIVDGAGVDRSCGSDNEERRATCLPIRGDGPGQSVEVHALPFINGNEPQRIAAEAGKIKRSRNASMHRLRRIGCQLL